VHAYELGDRLDFSPDATWTGGELGCHVCGGLPAGPAILILIDLNGTPRFQPVASGVLDPLGSWSFFTTTPAGLPGTVATFQALTFDFLGVLSLSPPAAIAFQ